MENNTTQQSAFTLIEQDNGIAHLKIDVVDESMNVLKAEFIEQIEAVLEQIRGSAIKGLVVYSGKDNSFVAGADISMLDACQSAEEASAIATSGQLIFNQLEQLSIPVVAAINGPCLGGGLELAMACHWRVASDSAKTVLGLPEVQLGLLPGSGGTQRLPKLVGLQKALDMMLTGKQLRAKQALKAGLVDDVVPQTILIEVAEQLALSAKSRPQRKTSITDKALESNALGRRLVFEQASKTVLAKTQGNYPAPLKIIECIRTGIEQGTDKGLAIEAKYFGELTQTPESKQLRNIFFATTQMKKEQGVEGVAAGEVHKVGILGGGLMGGGIAYVSVNNAKTPVRIKDINHQGIGHALKYSFDILNKKVKRRFLSKALMQQQMNRITGTLDYSGFNKVDMVIEAVFEDLELKQKMVADVEAHGKQGVIFASNTSSLPINQIAAKAKNPENVIGLHYFSPVDKMPLAEIIAHEKTSDETISTTVAYAKRQGKTPIVVKDKAGFYVNRILAPYVNEAANMLLQGEPIDKIDKALVKFGFPVGPIKLLDEVGIDIGAKISPILEAELGERFKAPDAFNKLIDDNRKGKKTNKGFYDYQSKKASGKNVDESVYSLLGVTPSSRLSSQDICQRSVLLMVNEAVRCLDEGIIRNPRDGDIGAIFGIGFPPFVGGPFRYLDSLGAQTVVDKLNQYKASYGEHFEPCEALVEMAKSNRTCY
ncbi:fatty acid oxidation complex subunit alpha FadJ [Thalassotalea ponticola]|uniref:fatty acid oxidation complex subunit alpha FadJ n=1 Tax=Thalassotalea ponticola TaxID=1523392 RepID=UPI0025B325F9|nr:fatty acid oxidation complex subunit alpha FadJ [Thalassotalea ponticola]MDN3651642.1 fatty acid oxidation complex subunit alpha FadJ [Thalassotalea ponticola]